MTQNFSSILSIVYVGNLMQSKTVFFANNVVRAEHKMMWSAKISDFDISSFSKKSTKMYFVQYFVQSRKIKHSNEAFQKVSISNLLIDCFLCTPYGWFLLRKFWCKMLKSDVSQKCLNFDWEEATKTKAYFLVWVKSQEGLRTRVRSMTGVYAKPQIEAFKLGFLLWFSMLLAISHQRCVLTRLKAQWSAIESEKQEMLMWNLKKVWEPE